ncbi:CYTH domain-containing protein [Candidatus Falkowbacteria bacterium]|nr:CYTH domain-containing protein [Candidatus Falkowbacteria bacterium]
MNIEYEATYYPVDKEQIRQILKKVGAKLMRPEFLMKRMPFHPPKDIGNAWLRVRDEGDKITMSLKKITGDKITDQKEVQLIIDNFDEGIKFLESIGAKQKSYQENLREIWHLDNAEICIDTWPGLKPLLEIESNNEADVKNAVIKLGLKWEDALFCAADKIYERELGIPKDVIDNKTPEITFKNPPKPYKK